MNSTLRFLRLADLVPLTPEQYTRSVVIRSQMRRLVDERDAYIREHGNDPSIAMPAANWGSDAANSFRAAYQFIFSGNYDVINRLRFYTQMFSGYQLMWLRSAQGQQQILCPVPEDHDQRLLEIAKEPDGWVQRYLAMTADLPEYAVARPPRILGEIGWDVAGHPVNHDVAVYQERLNLLCQSGILPALRARAARGEGITILEIGAGYGALAYFLRQAIPSARYYVCDLPESLLFSSLYLSLADPEVDKFIRFIPNYAVDELPEAGLRVDLAINTLSFAEMTDAQVNHYALLIASLLTPDGALFEQNQDNRGALPEGHYCYPKDILSRHFRECRTLTEDLLCTTPIGLTQGHANLWQKPRTT